MHVNRRTGSTEPPVQGTGVRYWWRAVAATALCGALVISAPGAANAAPQPTPTEESETTEPSDPPTAGTDSGTGPSEGTDSGTGQSAEESSTPTPSAQADRSAEPAAESRALEEGEYVLPGSKMTVVDVSSESPGYPGPDDVDGTADAVLTDNLSEAWTVAYADGKAEDPLPHWIVLDLGDTYDLWAVQYAMKAGTGHVKGYEIQLATELPAEDDGWGDPVATGELPVAPGQVQSIDLDESSSGPLPAFRDHFQPRRRRHRRREPAPCGGAG